MTLKHFFAYSALTILAGVVLVTPALAQVKNSPEFLACMQNAVEKRETSIGGAFDTYASSMKSALSERKNSLLNAWKIADETERERARKSAWEVYHKSAVNSRTALKGSRQSAWETFRTERKACGAPITDTSALDNATL